jgi:hypothetical protein
MFKNRGLGAKIGMGFGVLIVLVTVLGVFNWRGSTRVSRMVTLFDQGNTTLDRVSKCGALRRDFQAKGFAKATGEEKNSAEKWQDAYGQLISSLDTLKSSSALSKEQRELVDSAMTQTGPYKRRT